MSSASVNLPTVSALLVLDSEGGRVAVKYWDPAVYTPANTSSTKKTTESTTNKKEEETELQLAFEKKLFAKTGRSAQHRMEYETIPEVVLLDSSVVVYKKISDINLYVVGTEAENEIILHTVLQALDETMNNLLKGQVSKKTLVENLDLLLLSIDEIVDEGLILETDSQLVIGRVCMVGQGDKDVPLGEQTFTQALQMAKEQLVRSFK